MSLSIASVTVVYNAERRLARHLGSLLRQTHPLNEIIVVDNASTDGTAALLSERYPQVTVLRLAENLGMAGAWAAGLRYAALEKGHQWTWTFDDDSVPHYNTLKTLLLGIDSFNGAQSEVGILAPMPVHRTSGTVYPPLIWRDGLLRPSAELLKQPIWRADLVITSGCMVRREVVEKIGLPRADFFMDFFDFEYCLRARSHGYTIAVINGARLDHEIGDSRMIRLLGSVRLWMNQPPWREYYMTRNLSYMGWCLYPNFRTKKFVIRHLVIHAGCIALFGSRKVSCVRRMIQGFWDGIHGNLGIRFGPDNAEGRKAQDGLTSPRNAGAEEA